VNRREVLQKLAGTLAVVGVTAVTTKEKAWAQSGNCSPTQHDTYTGTYYFHSDCTQQDIEVNLTIKFSVQACTNADGSMTYKSHMLTHGSGQSIDPHTGQYTGNQYVIHEQEHERTVSVPSTPNGCSPFSTTSTYRLVLVSKGKAPDEQLVYTYTLTYDSSCQYQVHDSLDTDCHG
jgi:hypothetical protein